MRSADRRSTTVQKRHDKSLLRSRRLIFPTTTSDLNRQDAKSAKDFQETITRFIPSFSIGTLKFINNPKGSFSHSQVGNHLGRMNGSKFFNGFQFYYQPPSN